MAPRKIVRAVTVGLRGPEGPSGPPGGVQVRKFDFAFDTPELRDGITVYTPTPGEMLLAGWMEMAETWDGVTPKTGGAWADPVGDLNPTSAGVWQQLVGAVDLSLRVDPALQYAGIAAGYGGRISTAAPMRLWVSQDATPGGLDPGAAQGRATLYLVTA